MEEKMFFLYNQTKANHSFFYVITEKYIVLFVNFFQHKVAKCIFNDFVFSLTLFHTKYFFFWRLRLRKYIITKSDFLTFRLLIQDFFKEFLVFWTISKYNKTRTYVYTFKIEYQFT